MMGVFLIFVMASFSSQMDKLWSIRASGAPNGSRNYRGFNEDSTG
jgi:hypothetical protein